MSVDSKAESSVARVREATLADVPALQACYDLARHEDRIRRADGRTVHYLVAELDGQVVGFGRLTLVHSPGRPRLCYVPWISNLNVRADMRGRGMGTLLIREMERLTRAAGHRVIHIGVARNNPQALALYRRLGYEPIPDPPVDLACECVDWDEPRRPGVIYMSKPLPGEEG